MTAEGEVRLEGGCACGNIRYVLSAQPFDSGFCHCQTCRTTSGAPVLAYGSVLRSSFRLARGELARWRSSEFGERGFCGACGAQLTMRMDDQPGTLDVALATLDNPEAVAPRFHIWTNGQVRWLCIADDLPRYPMSRPATAGA